jgi:hypothetical protein
MGTGTGTAIDRVTIHVGRLTITVLPTWDQIILHSPPRDAITCTYGEIMEALTRLPDGREGTSAP